MRLIQLKDIDGSREVAVLDGSDTRARVLVETRTVYELALDAIAEGRSLAALAAARAGADTIDPAELEAEGRLLPPLDHPRDPAHCLVTGTGLSHLGSAEGRDKMHKKLAGDAPLTDSMKMFKLGLEGGKPAPGETGVQPEWFYKGDGGIVAAPGQPLAMPEFALDGGEEPELVGLYVVAPNGTPCRVGFALGNEFSDHITERQNYLYLAHSKLRACAFGPELLLGELPADLHGTSRILRNGEVLWEAPFVTGEANMSYSIANLEYHHFKYALFRRPGDIHCHFFGTATLSFSDGIKPEAGDVFEIAMPEFGRPLRNALKIAPPPGAGVRVL